jgi:predicted DCC family thiol-disulfide oxidoreductase YuxK
MNRRIIFYDGVCALCNWFVLFVIRFDTQGKFFFLAQENSLAKEFADKFNFTFEPGESVFVLDESDGSIRRKSDAVFYVLVLIGGVWSIISLFSVFPVALRDYVYDLVARNRYKFFGKLDSCPIPPHNIRSRFL